MIPDQSVGRSHGSPASSSGATSRKQRPAETGSAPPQAALLKPKKAIANQGFRFGTFTEWGRVRFGTADTTPEQRLKDLEGSLAQVKLDPAENVALLARLLDIPLPRGRA